MTNGLKLDANDWKNNIKRVGRDCPGNRVNCGSEWTQYGKETGRRCGQNGTCNMWTGNDEWTYKFCYRKNRLKINIGSGTKWNKQLDINCPIEETKVNLEHTVCNGWSDVSKENQFKFECTFDVDPYTASPTLLKILHKHRNTTEFLGRKGNGAQINEKRLSAEEYNKFMIAYLFTNMGDHKCTIDPKTQQIYKVCPKYFSQDAKEIQYILDEWRLENPDLWNASVQNYCSRFPNETFCECVGAENINSIHHNLFKQLGKIGSQIQCFFYPCQTPETRFTYTQYDDTTNCGESCAAFFNLDNDITLDQTYIDSYINCDNNNNNNKNKNENKVKNENKIENYYIYAGVAWIFIVFLYILF